MVTLVALSWAGLETIFVEPVATKRTVFPVVIASWLWLVLLIGRLMTTTMIGVLLGRLLILLLLAVRARIVLLSLI